ncbi:MAG: lipoyl(octanoyl) transferase LipB [Proteobacteria bacterium]|nr:lipoyl(octanoyl) transferase LipB [Pseudomonadota bacterium]
MSFLKTEWKQETAPVDYPTALEAMEARVAAIRNAGASDLVWLLEHPPLYTAGTSSNESELLDATRFPVYQAGRGGKHTYHGPGQRIAYTILDLQKRYPEPDLKKFVFDLEQWVIETLKSFGVKGERREGRVGIWVVSGKKEEKIAAIGIRVRKWVSFHGISLNVNPDMSHFSGIVPCGISEYGVTSLEKLGIQAAIPEVDKALKTAFISIFK